MPRTFEKRLVDLLPPVYREQDATGDLAAFLALPASALDDLKDLADRFPSIFDVDRCEDRFLPLLAALVGWPWEPTQDAARQRRQIREAVEFYRRKGTVPAIRRSLADIGWEGWIEETFRSAFRLNRRTRLNTKKLPGEIYSYGVYRVHAEAGPADLWPALRPHHPAGTRVFFRRLLQIAGDLDGSLEGYVNTIVRMVALGRLHEAFVLNRSQLNGHDPLTGRERAPVLMIASQTAFARQGFERAQTCVRAWHARTPCFRLNRSRLNRERLANVWASELVSAWCCCVSVEEAPSAPPPVIVLNHPRLNRARLNRTSSCCGVHRRQRDFVTVDDAPLSEALQMATGLALVSHARLDPRLTLGRSLLGGPERLAGAGESPGSFEAFDA
jgi:phage tail-like protein